MNHVLVDFENVHKIDLSVIGQKNVTFTLLLGAKLTFPPCTGRERVL